MTTTATPTNRRDIEETIGIDPIEVLQADRREVLKELAPLKAKYGPGGVWDAKRKAHRSAIANEIAAKVQAERGKACSEAELERLAAAEPRVQQLLDHAESEIAEYFRLDLQYTELTELINRDQALIRFAANEPR